MSIWKEELDLKKVNNFNKDCLIEHLGIEVTSFLDNGLEGIMPVDNRTVQPFKVLHGGASVVLAESLGSIGSNLLVDQKNQYVVGQSINANHLRSVTEGFVKATAIIIHKGRRSHVWEIKIVDENNKLVCVSRLTMAVASK